MFPDRHDSNFSFVSRQSPTFTSFTSKCAALLLYLFHFWMIPTSVCPLDPFQFPFHVMTFITTSFSLSFPASFLLFLYLHLLHPSICELLLSGGVFRRQPQGTLIQSNDTLPSQEDVCYVTA